MSMIDLAVTGGTVVTPEGVGRADVLVRGESILSVESPGGGRGAARIVDASGKIVLAGGVDVHTHFLIGFMGQRSVYDFHSGGVAALRGGTTTVIDFALQRRGRTMMDGVKHRRVQADRHVACDYGLHLIVTDVSGGLLDELPKVAAAGVTSIKAYMVYEKEQLRLDDGALLALLGAAGRLGMLVGVHAENAGIIDHETARRLAAGERAPKFHALARPAIAEAEAIHRAIYLAEKAAAPLYVFHLASGEGCDLIQAARGRGSRVFTETCPHYLALDADAYERKDAHLFVMSPPLRTKADQDRLWLGLKTGTVTGVASDDASFGADAKRLGAQSFETIANGVPGAEHRLPVFYTLAVAQGRLTLAEFAHAWSEGPARLFGLAPRKGAIRPGADADLVVVDPEARARLGADSNFGAIGYSPYAGMEVSGLPSVTVHRGQVVVEAGRFLGREGQGRFLARALPDTSLPK